MNNNNQYKNGVSFLSLLTLIFITLKLSKVITWSWIWVLSPMWIPTVIFITVIVILVLNLKRKKKGSKNEKDNF
ncbi:MAG: hypothetical protein HFJ13_08050 [Clostridium sp.]|jgi:hypothetical protein|uniref:hypothetical protein n=1 Tax=Clostridium sp. TaxID=1506 RepID=UPI0025C44345|nr:hypothetical protein [Clostridium sp.]MCI9070550.1 hypothetical protein [Clostridium sp.]MCI9304049.1 hypothetical protein [Clostridium sp.]